LSYGMGICSGYPWKYHNKTHDSIIIIIISISIQPMGQFGQEPEPSQATGMALVRCIPGKFLGVVCHCFPQPTIISVKYSSKGKFKFIVRPLAKLSSACGSTYQVPDWMIHTPCSGMSSLHLFCMSRPHSYVPPPVSDRIFDVTCF